MNMKMKIIILLSVALTGCGYVQFQPIQYDYKTEKYVIDNDHSGYSQENIIYVLNVFNEDYIIKENKIYISRKLWKDKERLWNYSNKASSDEWRIKRENNYKSFNDGENLNELNN